MIECIRAGKPYFYNICSTLNFISFSFWLPIASQWSLCLFKQARLISAHIILSVTLTISQPAKYFLFALSRKERGSISILNCQHCHAVLVPLLSRGKWSQVTILSAVALSKGTGAAPVPLFLFSPSAAEASLLYQNIRRAWQQHLLSHSCIIRNWRKTLPETFICYQSKLFTLYWFKLVLLLLT